MTAVSFLPPAEEEMTETAWYYESKCEGLGSDFLAEVEHIIEAIKVHPGAAPVIRNGIRRHLPRQKLLVQAEPDALLRGRGAVFTRTGPRTAQPQSYDGS